MTQYADANGNISDSSTGISSKWWDNKYQGDANGTGSYYSATNPTTGKAESIGNVKIPGQQDQGLPYSEFQKLLSTNPNAQWNNVNKDPGEDKSLMGNYGFLLPMAGMAGAGALSSMWGPGTLAGVEGASAGAGAGGGLDAALTSGLQSGMNIGNAGGLQLAEGTMDAGSAAAGTQGSNMGGWDLIHDYFVPQTADAGMGASGFGADATQYGMGTSAGGGIATGAGTLPGQVAGGSGGLLSPFQGGLDKINDFLGLQKNPITMGNLLGSGANYFINKQRQDELMAQAQKAGAMSNALDQPQRQPYQGMLSSLLTNPSQFYSTNPAVKGQLDLAKQQFEANSAKMGTGGTQFSDYLRNVQNIASGTFNDQANLLSGLGGFNQGPGYSGNVYGSLAGQASNAGAEAFRGFGQDLFKQPGSQGQGQIFGQSGSTGATGTIMK